MNKMNTSRCRRARTNGFTLIEMLIVIAIIGILAAILFPVFARARENARRASCQSNMKQICLGIIQYVQDYDERFPPEGGSGGACTSNSNYTGTGLSWAVASQPYVKSTQIFKCPSDARGAAFTSSYSYNWQLGPSLGYQPYIRPAMTTAPSAPVSLAQVGQSSKVVMWFEDRWTNTSWGTIECENFSDQFDAGAGFGYTAHLDGMNLAFVDGHVKWFKIAPQNSPVDTPAGHDISMWYGYTG